MNKITFTFSTSFPCPRCKNFNMLCDTDQPGRATCQCPSCGKIRRGNVSAYADGTVYFEPSKGGRPHAQPTAVFSLRLPAELLSDAKNKRRNIEKLILDFLQNSV